MNIHFYKYQGTGNDFILIDDRDAKFPDSREVVAGLCERRFGIGADGLILLQKSDDSAFFMKYYNSDGNESSMCGNGGRCIAAFANHLHITGNETNFIAMDGMHDAIISGEGNELFVKLKMQDIIKVEQRDEHTFVVNTGSPHFVKFIHEDIETLELVEEARKTRYNNEFKDEGINVNFVNLGGIKSIKMRTYERGVEDETLSCGTGVTAAALCTAILNGLPEGVHTVHVKTKGGELSVKFNYNALLHLFSDVWLQGPAKIVFEGDMEI